MLFTKKEIRAFVTVEARMKNQFTIARFILVLILILFSYGIAYGEELYWRSISFGLLAHFVSFSLQFNKTHISTLLSLLSRKIMSDPNSLLLLLNEREIKNHSKLKD